ncbi:MAG TPA: sulfatase-like hydrolase/transferase, partial [Pararhizobium sp.]|nr:sulfatase-like hydrolase/transferase [Pararhizobium sp.]
ALTDEVIKEADQMRDPFFYFVVTLQNHGPYEAHRYQHTHVEVKAPGISEASRQSALSYAEGVHDADQAFARLVDWAKNRSRPTILVFFGDHLPPLGPVYVETGFLKQNVAPRKAPVPDMLRQHGTPLVVWSNRGGTVETGTISPSLISLQILTLAGMTHPYYTGFLGQVRDKYRVIDRQLLLEPDGKTGIQDWVAKKRFKPLIDQYRLIQYDVMFGNGYSKDVFFPSTKQEAPKTAIEIGHPATNLITAPAG